MPSTINHQPSAALWALTDNRPGTRVQVMGVAEKLGMAFQEKKLEYTALAMLPNCLLGASLAGITNESAGALSAPWPKAVIAAGRRAAPVARYIKQQSPSTKLIHLMWPESSPEAFDLIALPAHDKERPGHNIIRTLLTPHSLTKEKLEKAAAEWKLQFSHLRKPFTAVILGGAAKGIRFDARDMQKIAEIANQIGHGGSVLITTSRRTDLSLLPMLEQSLTLPYYLYRWSADTPNPYHALLGLADKLIVTADSVSMLSEACFTGKPIYAYSPRYNLSRKHKRFVSELVTHGMVQIEKDALPATPAIITARDDAHTIAEAAKRILV